MVVVLRVGDTLKKLRKRKNLTLQMVSQRTGFSVAFLSKLERGLTSPTLDQLHAVTELYDVSLSDLLAEPQPFLPVVRSQERMATCMAGSSICCDLTTSLGLSMRGLCMTIAADFYGDEVSWGHDRDWYGIVIEGKLHLDLDGVSYVLEPGDAVFIAAHTPHRYHKLNDGACVCYWTEQRLD